MLLGEVSLLDSLSLSEEFFIIGLPSAPISGLPSFPKT